MSHLNEDQKQPITAAHNVTNVAVQDAMAAAADEKAMGFKAVMRIHWRAALWSCIFSLALVMEGYDLGIVSDKGIGDAEADQLLLGSSVIP
jgi:hypothetical protein